MPDRFYHSPPLSLGETRLDGAEAHHLLHVLRAKPGLEVVLFDGSGAEFDATVQCTDRAAIDLVVWGRREVDREPDLKVTLGAALPKGDRQRWLVEKATELGVARLVPLMTTRGVAQPVGAALARFQRGVIEAAKQCGRNRLMEIGQPQSWSEFVGEHGSIASTRLVAHPGGIALNTVLRNDGSAAREIWLAVGPEGGLTELEVEQALAAGWLAVDLGRRLLRTDTAAIALAAWVVLGG